jgi:transglutaminase-like putative cysteine protease
MQFAAGFTIIWNIGAGPALKRQPPTKPFSSGLAFAAIFRISQLHSVVDLGYQRFVSCYAFGLVPPDFHAVFEAYLGGRWWLFDATRQAHLDGLVRIGVGRDAAEVAFSTPFGTFEPKGMNVRIAPSDGCPDQGPRTVDAISTDDALNPTTASSSMTAG